MRPHTLRARAEMSVTPLIDERLECRSAVSCRLKPSDQLDQSPMSESVLENVQLDCKRGSRDILRTGC